MVYKLHGLYIKQCIEWCMKLHGLYIEWCMKLHGLYIEWCTNYILNGV